MRRASLNWVGLLESEGDIVQHAHGLRVAASMHRKTLFIKDVKAEGACSGEVEELVIALVSEIIGECDLLNVCVQILPPAVESIRSLAGHIWDIDGVLRRLLGFRVLNQRPENDASLIFHDTVYLRDQLNAEPSPADRALVAFPFDAARLLPVGSWVVLPVPDYRGVPVACILPVDPSAEIFYLPEIDDTGRLHPSKRKDVAVYARRLREGHEPPPISAIEMEDGRIRVVDGHRRSLAAIQCDRPIKAIISPMERLNEESPKPIVMGDFPAWMDSHWPVFIERLMASSTPQNYSFSEEDMREDS